MADCWKADLTIPNLQRSWVSSAEACGMFWILPPLRTEFDTQTMLVFEWTVLLGTFKNQTFEDILVPTIERYRLRMTKAT